MHRIATITFLFICFSVFSQSDIVWLHPNDGQWDKEVVHKVKLVGGDMYVLKNGFGYNFHNGAEVYHQHDDLDHDKKPKTQEPQEKLRGQYIKATFEGSTWTGQKENALPSSFYSNYYLGKDQSKWRSLVTSFQKSNLLNVYPGINLNLEGQSSSLKYSWIVAPFASPDLIKMKIEGANKVEVLSNGQLIIHHDFGNIRESRPIAYQWINDVKTTVETSFKLNNNTVTFDLGEFDPNFALVIDPNLTFSTFSGSTADNWGSTATPGPNGTAFGGGIVFGTGLPVTVGAYDPTYNNTSYGFDVSIMKFSSNGANLLYSTYLGGSENEFPSSMVARPNGELYVLGITGSPNFPINGGFDNSFAGGTAFNRYGLNFSTGSDIFIARFNANGTALLSSTFLGGIANDGVNIGALDYNLGDSYRGEIIVDTLGNVYIASSTNSADFPLSGAGGQVYNGTQSAIAVKLTSNLSSLLWSRYISGSDLDAGISLQISSLGNVFVAGGTNSTDLVLSSGNALTYRGGASDGFVIKLNGMNGGTVAGTYVGQGTYDQVYFVQLDVQDRVYVLGQTNSNWPISPGKYGNPNSGLFIRQYSNNLQTINWTTMIGGSGGHVEISPTAFLVSDCYDIYLSGWGGSLNASYGQATQSSSAGMPVTPNAYQTTTSGNNFYLAVLSPNATGLKYGTFFGNVNSSSNHVDGGTSRFDKNGNIYHAACAGCGGSPNGFTSTPGAWSTTNNSTNCNMAVFKFDLGVIAALATIAEPLICYPDPVVFLNYTQNANVYQWTFGDGGTSIQQSPTHQYPGPGTYTAILIVSDSNNCYTSDTTTLIINIGDFSGAVTQPSDTVCPNEPLQLQASGGSSYLWTPANKLSNPNISNPIATVDTTTTFRVIVSDSCGVDTLFLQLNVFHEVITVSSDTSMCVSNSYQLSASGGTNYQWSPATYLDDPNIANPVTSPDSSITYNVLISTANACQFTKQVFVSVFYGLPVPVMDDTVLHCRYASSNVAVSGATGYEWFPYEYISSNTSQNVNIYSPISQYYNCAFTNSCGTVWDSIYVQVQHPTVLSSPNVTVCLGEQAQLSASGAATYNWYPAYLVDDPNSDTVMATVVLPIQMIIVGSDILGCIDSATITLNVFPSANVNAYKLLTAEIGDALLLEAKGNSMNGTYEWSPDFALSCVFCQSTLASPNENTIYEVVFTDTNGCIARDQIKIVYEPIIFVPNTFTPNSDGKNELFRVEAYNIRTFYLEIFNRWGELIHTMDTKNNGWNGQFKGETCPQGLYTWKLSYNDFNEQPEIKVGHLMILR